MARGRRSDSVKWIEEDKLLLLKGWARDGLTDKQIAEDKIGIAETTFCAWKNRHPEIVKALKKGKEVVDREVEGALYKRAIGYEYEETITEIVEQQDGSTRKHIKKIKKIALPDVTAQIYWLKNRKPVEWRDKREQEITVTNNDESIKEMDNFFEGMKAKDAD